LDENHINAASHSTRRHLLTAPLVTKGVVFDEFFRRLAWEAHEIEDAGLVEISAAQGDDPNLVVIKRVTAEGRRVLGILREKGAARCLKRALTAAGVPSMDLEVALL
jgi:hypothetical protein